MSEDERAFLDLESWPGTLSLQQTGWALGVSPAHVLLLVRLKKLCPLGKLRKNSVRVFAATKIRKLSQDERWLNEAWTSIATAIQTKNRKAKKSRILESATAPRSSQEPVNSSLLSHAA